MPIQYKILGQINPSPNTLTNLFVTSAESTAIVTAVSIANLNTSSNATYSLVSRPIDEALADKHHFIRAGVIPPSEQITITPAITMNVSTIFAANSNLPNLVFHAYGSEIL